MINKMMITMMMMKSRKKLQSRSLELKGEGAEFYLHIPVVVFFLIQFIRC